MLSKTYRSVIDLASNRLPSYLTLYYLRYLFDLLTFPQLSNYGKVYFLLQVSRWTESCATKPCSDHGWFRFQLVQLLDSRVGITFVAMDSDDYRCQPRSGGSSPPDPLARLSDYAAESSCSSWSSSDDESLSYHAASLQLQPQPLPSSSPSPPPPPPPTNPGARFAYSQTNNWQQRYTHLQAEMSRYRRQANRTRDMLQQKVGT